MKRQVFFDINTTSRQPYADGRIVEIACVEVINRKVTGRVFHHYINPQKPVSLMQLEKHGLTDAFLANKPLFTSLADDFIDFVRHAELICIEMAYSKRFIEAEVELINDYLTVEFFTDGLIEGAAVAKNKFWGWSNRDVYSLCRYLDIPVEPDNLKSALYRATLFVEVYQAMTSLPTVDSCENMPYIQEAEWLVYMTELCKKHDVSGKVRFDYAISKPLQTIDSGGYAFRHQKGTMTEFEDDWFVRRVMHTNQLMFEERLRNGLLNLPGGEIIMTKDAVTLNWCTPDQIRLLYDNSAYASTPQEKEPN